MKTGMMDTVPDVTATSMFNSEGSNRDKGDERATVVLTSHRHRSERIYDDRD